MITLAVLLPFIEMAVLAVDVEARTWSRAPNAPSDPDQLHGEALASGGTVARLWKTTGSGSHVRRPARTPVAKPLGMQRAAPPVSSPRDVFFSDHVLYSAEEEVMTLGTIKLAVLAAVLEKCDPGKTGSAALQRGCALELSRLLFVSRPGGEMNRLLGAIFFMTALADYNREIGRKDEISFALRLAAIYEGLSDALKLARFARLTGRGDITSMTD